MARVSATFKDNFDFWSGQKIRMGDFTQAEMAELKGMIRQDLTEGPDQLRQGLTVITAAGVAVPALIDDAAERYALWDGFFAAECAEIQGMQAGLMGAEQGINQRIRADLVERKRKAA